MPSLHVVIPTHTTRHLRRTLMGVASQTRRPDSVTVSCDNDDPAIAALVRATAAEFGMPFTLVQRPFQGSCRLSQVRNNGVRAAREGIEDGGEEDRIVFLDGDCCPAPDALARHEELGRGADLVIGFRIDLSPEQTEGFSEADVRAGRPPAAPTREQVAALRARDGRYRRQLLLRRLGVAKRHKPKVLGANHSISLGMYLRINGYDEAFQEYGSEDDDFGRRVYAAGASSAVGVASIIVFHQYHPTRAPAGWHEAPGAKRFGLPFTTRCRSGIDSPLPQDVPVVTRFTPGGADRRDGTEADCPLTSPMAHGGGSRPA